MKNNASDALKDFFLRSKYLLSTDYRFQVSLMIFTVIAMTAIWYSLHKNIESTDNATVQCELIDVVSEVNGVIEEINFKDDQSVDKNQPLVKIEDALFQAQLDRSLAALNIAKSNYRETGNSEKLLAIELQADLQKSEASRESAIAVSRSMDSAIDEAKQELNSSSIDMEYLKQNYEREKELKKKKFISEREFENTKRVYYSKVANHSSLLSKITKLNKLRDAEKANVFNSGKSYETLVKSKDHKIENSQMESIEAKNSIGLAQAEYNLAKLNMDRTISKAKISGSITSRRISVGEYIEVGQRIASIVSCQDKPWISANFKETQIARMRTGQRAEFTIDTYPGITFKGTLESISSGTGSTFSVLPPENATGNFTKVVKRMPVKISVDSPNNKILRVGSSVNAEVFIK